MSREYRFDNLELNKKEKVKCPKCESSLLKRLFSSFEITKRSDKTLCKRNDGICEEETCPISRSKRSF